MPFAAFERSVSCPSRICDASLETRTSSRGSIPVRVTPIRPRPWSMIAVVFTDGATSPGNHDRSDAMTASGYLIPGRRLTFGTFDIPTAAYSSSAGWLGTDRRSSSTVTWGIVSTSCRRKSICDPCIKPAIMIVKPTPIATPNMPTSVCRTRVLTWVHAMLSKRFVVMRLAYRVALYLPTFLRASLTMEST